MLKSFAMKLHSPAMACPCCRRLPSAQETAVYVKTRAKSRSPAARDLCLTGCREAAPGLPPGQTGGVHGRLPRRSSTDAFHGSALLGGFACPGDTGPASPYHGHPQGGQAGCLAIQHEHHCRSDDCQGPSGGQAPGLPGGKGRLHDQARGQKRVFCTASRRCCAGRKCG